MAIENHHPSRRTVAKGVAWTVPAVAVASAMPAFASSPLPPVTPPTPNVGATCKHPGNSCGKNGWTHAYRYEFCMTNKTANEVVVNFPKMDVNGKTQVPIPTTITVPAGVTDYCFWILVNKQGNSANGQATLYYNYEYTDDDGETHKVDSSVQTGMNDLPPCPDCEPNIKGPYVAN